MLKLESPYQGAYVKYQHMPVLSRKDAQKYQQLLHEESPLYQEINRILATYKNGIHQLSSGQKIGATEMALRGGNKESQIIELLISPTDGAQSFRFTAPRGKNIVDYSWKAYVNGEEKETALKSLVARVVDGSFTEKDTKNWERSGEAEVRANAGGFIPLTDVGVHASAVAKDEKTYEEDYSVPKLVVEVKPKKPGIGRTSLPIKVVLTVCFEDVPVKNERIPLEISAIVSGSTSAKGISSITGSSPASQETASRISSLTAAVKDSTTLDGSIDVKANPCPIANEKQMQDRVDIESFHSEIDRIDKEIDKLESQESSFAEKCSDAKNEHMQEFYSKKLAALSEEIAELKTRKKGLQGEIDKILKNRGKEEEKK